MAKAFTTDILKRIRELAIDGSVKMVNGFYYLPVNRRVYMRKERRKMVIVGAICFVAGIVVGVLGVRVVLTWMIRS